MRRNCFDGIGGRATAKVMARMNREAEIEAIEILSPSQGNRILAIGIGPGVGVDQLAKSIDPVSVVGIDPSAAMLADARRRNKTWLEAGTVELLQTTADALVWEDGSFDGAVAVNSIQMWDPFDVSLREVSRVLRPGGRLVAVTHDWALKKSTGREPEAWFKWVAQVGDSCGLIQPRMWRARAEEGRAVAFEATRRSP